MNTIPKNAKNPSWCSAIEKWKIGENPAKKIRKTEPVPK